MYMLSFQAVGKRSRAEQAPRVRFTSPPPSPLHSTKPPSPSLTTGTSSHPPTLTTGTSSHSPPTLTTGTTKRAVYIKEETVQFPSTEVGSETSVKVKVCNRDKCQHQVHAYMKKHVYSILAKREEKKNLPHPSTQKTQTITYPSIQKHRQ